VVIRDSEEEKSGGINNKRKLSIPGTLDGEGHQEWEGGGCRGTKWTKGHLSDKDWAESQRSNF